MLPFSVLSEDYIASVMIFMISLTAEELTFESHFLFFSELFFCKGNSFISISFKNLGSCRFLSFSEMAAADLRIFAGFNVSPPKEEV